MNDNEILQKAVKRANKNAPKGMKFTAGIINVLGSHPIRYYHLIFDHEFCQAFWGEELLFCGKSLSGFPKDADNQVFKREGLSVKAWKYHLQQMVLEENPIQYLSKFL